ncbi:hypothetical protein [Spirochaeta isovalerica]|uniref:Outer membrane protein beta-barrel domain-containing protein n=1 Tax=Spirochaeta isovalerica TaxID=150 RepID=A0A841RCN8_9SPIO|nr:hypothetical protein [Spirochaeta isovalerica]MBB6481755.1 hypothetical protein [Spirochaeta isovalerica]
MKNKLITTLIFLCLPLAFAAGEERKTTIGLHILGGGRYDDVRMCVGSPQGVKGGPIMEVYLDIRIPAGERGTLAVNIPVMRPILFGVAFQMMQFEPQVTYEYLFPTGSEKIDIVLGGGLGAVFHYGPDYNSAPEDRGESFFSAGPLFTASAGIVFHGRSGNWTPGVKAFYAPLFSSGYDNGHVLGGGVELHYGY